MNNRRVRRGLFALTCTWAIGIGAARAQDNLFGYAPGAGERQTRIERRAVELADAQSAGEMARALAARPHAPGRLPSIRGGWGNPSFWDCTSAPLVTDAPGTRIPSQCRSALPVPARGPSETALLQWPAGPKVRPGSRHMRRER